MILEDCLFSFVLQQVTLSWIRRDTCDVKNRRYHNQIKTKGRHMTQQQPDDWEVCLPPLLMVTNQTKSVRTDLHDVSDVRWIQTPPGDVLPARKKESCVNNLVGRIFQQLNLWSFVLTVGFVTTYPRQGRLSQLQLSLGERWGTADR